MQKFLQSALLILASASSPILATAAYADQPRPAPAAVRADTTAAERKWETDPAVRTAMGEIRQTMLASQPDIEQDRLGTRDYQRLAERVNTSIAGLKKNARLPREAADALHTIVLMDLMRSSEMMQSSQKLAVQRVGALGVLQSLRLYGEHFAQTGQHPGLATAH